VIHGIGTDIAAVERLSGLHQRHGQSALERLLAPVEFAAFEQAPDKGRFLAKRFAAKEAFAKALGTGLRFPAVLTAIAVVHDALGKPTLEYFGDLAVMMAELALDCHLSISDERDYAVAFVVLERRQK
jgi:holo-[acyl-carrier protein] synthase